MKTFSRRWLLRNALCALAASALVLPVLAADEIKPAPAKNKENLVPYRVVMLPLLTADEIKPAPVQNIQPVSTVNSTHEQVKAVTIRSKDGRNGVQTFCLDAEGRILALVAPQRGFSGSTQGAKTEVHLLDAEGKYLKHWAVDFHGQSINVGPDGSIYVAGDAKVAKFDREGSLQAKIDLPHVNELLKDKAGLRKQAEEQVSRDKAMYENMVKQYTERVKKIEAKPEADRSKTEKNQLQQYKQILQSYQQTEQFYAKRTVDQVTNEITGRLRVINAIALTPKDIFICCGETQGYGFAIWRLTPEFKEPKLIKGKLSGCCGQMDIQTHGEDLLIAENCSHSFARYDRDGKEKARGGKRGKETDPGCFGSCCNPMNVRAASNGDIFTAESEGHVKRFSADGKFLGFVGSCKLQGGCKNVSVAVSPKGDRVYFCDQPGARIIIMAEKKATASNQ